MKKNVIRILTLSALISASISSSAFAAEGAVAEAAIKAGRGALKGVMAAKAAKDIEPAVHEYFADERLHLASLAQTTAARAKYLRKLKVELAKEGRFDARDAQELADDEAIQVQLKNYRMPSKAEVAKLVNKLSHASPGERAAVYSKLAEKDVLKSRLEGRRDQYSLQRFEDSVEKAAGGNIGDYSHTIHNGVSDQALRDLVSKALHTNSKVDMSNFTRKTIYIPQDLWNVPLLGRYELQPSADVEHVTSRMDFYNQIIKDADPAKRAEAIDDVNQIEAVLAGSGGVAKVLAKGPDVTPEIAEFQKATNAGVTGRKAGTEAGGSGKSTGKAVSGQTLQRGPIKDSSE